MDLNVAKTGFLDELTKIAADLTPSARADLPKKDFAVSAKSSNTGKPAYPIEDKAHAKAALGLSAMHGDAKDVSEVRKDVAKKYPGLVKEKKAAGVNAAMFKAASASAVHAIKEGGLAGALGKA